MTANVTIDETVINVTVPPPVSVTIVPKTASVAIERQLPLSIEVGVQGPQGASGGNTTTIFGFANPSTSWGIAHYLNRYPSVTLIDTAGDQLFASISYVDRNNIVAQFSAPTSGVAYLN